MNFPLTSQHKLVISGLFVEHYHYTETSIPYGYKRQIGKKTEQSVAELYETEPQKEDKARQVALMNRVRTKRTVHRLIETNVYQYPDKNQRPITPKFVTLTFAKHITDIKQANRIYSKYIQRLNYLIYGKQCSNLAYLNVIEFTKIGRIHYHTMFFNLISIEKNLLEKTWSQGYARIKSVYKVTNLARYMTKYMAKGFDDVRLTGKKRYFTSKNLIKPLTVREEEVVEKILSSLPFTRRTQNFLIDSPYIGLIEYTQHRMPPNLNGVYSIDMPYLSPLRAIFENKTNTF